MVAFLGFLCEGMGERKESNGDDSPAFVSYLFCRQTSTTAKTKMCGNEVQKVEGKWKRFSQNQLGFYLLILIGYSLCLSPNYLTNLTHEFLLAKKQRPSNRKLDNRAATDRASFDI